MAQMTSRMAFSGLPKKLNASRSIGYKQPTGTSGITYTPGYQSQSLPGQWNALRQSPPSAAPMSLPEQWNGVRQSLPVNTPPISGFQLPDYVAQMPQQAAKQPTGMSQPTDGFRPPGSEMLEQRSARPGWETALQQASQTQDPAALNQTLSEYWDDLPSHMQDAYSRSGFGPTATPEDGRDGNGGGGGTPGDIYSDLSTWIQQWGRAQDWGMPNPFDGETSPDQPPEWYHHVIDALGFEGEYDRNNRMRMLLDNYENEMPEAIYNNLRKQFPPLDVPEGGEPVPWQGWSSRDDLEWYYNRGEGWTLRFQDDEGNWVNVPQGNISTADGGIEPWIIAKFGNPPPGEGDDGGDGRSVWEGYVPGWEDVFGEGSHPEIWYDLLGREHNWADDPPEDSPNANEGYGWKDPDGNPHWERPPGRGGDYQPPAGEDIGFAPLDPAAYEQKIPEGLEQIAERGFGPAWMRSQFHQMVDPFAEQALTEQRQIRGLRGRSGFGRSGFAQRAIGESQFGIGRRAVSTMGGLQAQIEQQKLGAAGQIAGIDIRNEQIQTAIEQWNRQQELLGERFTAYEDQARRQRELAKEAYEAHSKGEQLSSSMMLAMMGYGALGPWGLLAGGIPWLTELFGGG